MDDKRLASRLQKLVKHINKKIQLKWDEYKESKSEKKK